VASGLGVQPGENEAPELVPIQDSQHNRDIKARAHLVAGEEKDGERGGTRRRRRRRSRREYGKQVSLALRCHLP